MSAHIPWAPKSASLDGRQSEKIAAKKYGARQHSNSGSGVEKFDFSTEETVYEHKEANRTHTINGKLLDKLFTNASVQGKQGVYVIHFKEANVTLEGLIKRG